MKNSNEDLLNVDEIGTSKRINNNKENMVNNLKDNVDTRKREKPNLKRDVQRLINWLDNNVLPVVALIVIAGLAVKGLSIFLPEMNETTRTVASILAVAILVVKLQAGKVK